MHLKNVEFKARVEDLSVYENLLQKLNPIFQGEDHQIDTYFNTEKGRLKLREGTIENALIQYDRPDKAEAKLSNIILYKHPKSDGIKEILKHQFGIKIIVDKRRKIYFIDHIKFHFDIVNQLGTFIEVEAIDTKGIFSTKKLKADCDYYFEYFKLEKNQLVHKSYSDLMMQ